jgi:hypothetical protein
MDLTMMERVGDREEKMEGSCSTGQIPQWAAVPVEEEEFITARQRISPQVIVKDFTKCCISNAMDKTDDDMLWNTSKEDGNDWCACEEDEGNDCEDEESDDD